MPTDEAGNSESLLNSGAADLPVYYQDKVVCIWINLVLGGHGHFGVDLKLSDGYKVPGYYFNPRFGSPLDDKVYEHGLFLTNFASNGSYHGYASKLAHVQIEIYPLATDSFGRLLHCGLFTTLQDFDWHPYPDGPCYSSHVGHVTLPRVDWTPGRENFGRLAGVITRNGDPRIFEEVNVDFRQYAPASVWSSWPNDSAVRWPMFGYSSTGFRYDPNDPKPATFNSGPMVPADYEVLITHHIPDSNKVRQVKARLGAWSPHDNFSIEVTAPGFGLPRQTEPNGTGYFYEAEMICTAHPEGHPRTLASTKTTS